MSIWWCNQTKDWVDEFPAGVVCGSDRGIQRTTYRKLVGEVKRGDIVVHYRDRVGIYAFSRAAENGQYHNHLPLVNGKNYHSGWRFGTAYHQLKNPISRDLFIEELKDSLPDRRPTYYAIGVRGIMEGYFFVFDEVGLRIVLRHTREELPPWLRSYKD